MISIISYTLILVIIISIAWLVNREISKSKKRSNNSEIILLKERSMLEDILNKRTDELIASEKQRVIELNENARFGELAKGLFHDLMNPLSSLTLYIESMINKKDNTDEAKEMLKKTVSAGKRMESFMNSIKRSSTSIMDNKNSSDLLQELSIVKDILAYRSRMNNVSIKIQCKNTTILHIHPVRLHQLLLNLVSNALDACIVMNERNTKDEYEGKITIDIKREGIKLEIIVEDNGCGIPEAISEKVFNEPFTTKEKGSGIGLITVREIVEKELKGKIEMSSKENKGTVCRITIPTN